MDTESSQTTVSGLNFSRIGQEISYTLLIYQQSIRNINSKKWPSLDPNFLENARKNVLEENGAGSVEHFTEQEKSNPIYSTTDDIKSDKLKSKNNKKISQIKITSNLSEINLDNFVKVFAKFATGVCCEETDLKIEPKLNKNIQVLTSKSNH